MTNPTIATATYTQPTTGIRIVQLFADYRVKAFERIAEAADFARELNERGMTCTTGTAYFEHVSGLHFSDANARVPDAMICGRY